VYVRSAVPGLFNPLYGGGRRGGKDAKKTRGSIDYHSTSRALLISLLSNLFYCVVKKKKKLYTQLNILVFSNSTENVRIAEQGELLLNWLAVMETRMNRPMVKCVHNLRNEFM
jgi:hypothetical protein